MAELIKVTLPRLTGVITRFAPEPLFVIIPLLVSVEGTVRVYPAAARVALELIVRAPPPAKVRSPARVTGAAVLEMVTL